MGNVLFLADLCVPFYVRVKMFHDVLWLTISRSAASAASPLQRGVGRHHGTTSRPDVLHERSDLHDLDGGAHTIETRHTLKQLISKERFGSVF